MKSLVEEASSIAKAIEKAWERAGKPQSFSIKIYEMPEKNFFGFTKKSAKIGIFFEEEVFKKTYDRNRPYQQKNGYKNQNNEQKIDRENRQNNKPQIREEDRKMRHNQSNQQLKNEQNNNKQEHRERIKDQEKSDFRNQKQQPQRNSIQKTPYENKNNRNVLNSNDSKNKASENYQSKNQALVSNFQFSEENEQIKPTTPSVVKTEQPIIKEQVQTTPINQSSRKVLKVSSRMYTRPKNTSDSDSENK